MDDSKLEEFQTVIGYRFKDLKLLKQALTHSSYANELKINKIADYERLEFLGDAVLEMVSSKALFCVHKDWLEGKLTKQRAAMVCEQSLAFCGRDFGLDKYIYLGKGEEASGGRDRDSIISDVCEALIGAIYLDSDIYSAENFIHKFILNDLADKELFFDAKSKLQEVAQNLKKELTYNLVGESGPEHDKKFKVRVLMDEDEMGLGEGRTKKAAQQDAAYKTLLMLKGK
ncbi:MAG: ribonuclease III [Lachnospiraceae bacterium]|nr:ribonuclease III [Lachnospiraceae bacterium]